MNYRRNFNYTYTTDKDDIKVARLNEICFIPYITFNLVYKNEYILCHLDNILDEWQISFPSKCKAAPLATLDDVFWNRESIYDVLEDDELAQAISKAIFEIYREYQHILG